YSLAGGSAYGFQVPTYDRSRPLVIDPGLVYSTYLGGSELDQPFSIAVDAAGNAYVGGRADSSDFPTTPGAFDTTHSDRDAVVSTRHSPSCRPVDSTFYRGSGTEPGGTITLVAAGG